MSSSVSCEHIPNIDIQHDWNIGVEKSSSEKFWVSCQLTGKDSAHGSLSNAALLNLPQRSGDFTVTSYNQQSVTISFNDGGCATTFLAPEKAMHLHRKSLYSLDISASGGLGVCSSDNGKVWIWDTEDGFTRRSLDGHAGDVYSCRFFPSGLVVLTGGADTRLKIWSVQDGQCARTMTGHRRVINDTAIIEKGRNFISVASDGLAKLWDCGTGKCLSDLASLPAAINSCSLQASHEQYQPQSGELECGTGGKLLLLACEDGTVCAIDMASKKQIFSRNLGGALNCCSFFSDVTVASGSDNGEISIIDLRNTNSILQSFSFSTAPVKSMALVGSRCVAGCADGACYLFSAASPSNGLVKFTGCNLDSVNCVQAHDNVLYTACKDGLVRCYDTQHIII